MKIPFQLIAAIFLMNCTVKSYGQDSATIIPLKTFKAIVITTDKLRIDGVLQEINDSSVKVSDSRFSLRDYSYNNIQQVKLQRKGSVGRGMLIGGLSGFVTGFLIGLISGDDDPNEWFAMTASQKGAALGLGLGITGTLTGALLGLTHKKFIISGRKEEFEKMKTKMRKRLVGNTD